MTAATVEIDYETPAPAMPESRPQRWWLAAVGGFLTGVLLVVGVVLTPPRPASAVAGAVQHTIGFLVGGNAASTTGLVRTRDGEHVQGSSEARYDSPTVAVLSVTATRTGEAMCRITVDGIPLPEQTATNGKTALCVWSAAG